jgi:hypothetical protein
MRRSGGSFRPARRRPAAALAFVFLICVLAPAVRAAREDVPAPAKPVPVTDMAIRVDGRLDEPAWERALVFTLDYEVSPGQLVPAPVRTECFVLRDDANLYIGFRAHDPDPKSIRAYLGDHDSLWNDDRVGVILDTFNDGRRGFAFFVNPVGVIGDEILSKGGQNAWDASWDAIWDAAAAISDQGYTAELAVPFHALQYQRRDGDQVWGFTAMRYYPRSLPHFISSDPIDRNRNCFLCQLSKITGLGGLRPTQAVELDPTLTWFREEGRDPFPGGPLKVRATKTEAGLSGRWNITPNMALSGAWNPDFSQVEADAMQFAINTQFALSYPEKRPLFLEGKDFFQTKINAVYTRAVADPDWGFKLSGKEGDHAFGLFAARDAATNIILPGNRGSRTASLGQGTWAGILRYRYDLGEESTVGLLVTDREGPSYANRVAGLDGVFHLSRNDTVDIQALGSFTRYPETLVASQGLKREAYKGSAVTFLYTHEEKNWYWNAGGQELDAEFRADLGFVPQADYRKGTAGAGYIRRGAPGEFLSRLDVGGDFFLSSDCGWRLIEREFAAKVAAEGPWQTKLQLTAARRRYVYENIPFDQIVRSGSLSLAPARDLRASISLDLGDEVDFAQARPGKKFILKTGLDYNLGRRLKLEADYSLNRLDVADGRLFDARLTRLLVLLLPGRRWMFRGIIQLMDIDRRVERYALPVPPRDRTFTSQLLLSWKLNPRTVLYLGYADDYLGAVDTALIRRGRTLFFKAGYAVGVGL